MFWREDTPIIYIVLKMENIINYSMLIIASNTIKMFALYM